MESLYLPISHSFFSSWVPKNAKSTSFRNSFLFSSVPKNAKLTLFRTFPASLSSPPTFLCDQKIHITKAMQVMEDSLPIAMNGGHGPNSYTTNSQFQKEGSERAKSLLSKSIQEALDVQKHMGTFSMADLGCSVGPNTFTCVETIIEAVQNKFKTIDPNTIFPEFHVFFNDYVLNDFNTLFKALPSERNYMAAAVPGSFHGRLFPEASMNLMHSAFTLHWLSKIPEQLKIENSLAYNKGRVTYALSSQETVKAFTSQFLSDMKDFFDARSLELASGGLMAIIMPCRPEGTLPSESVHIHIFECLGSAIADMAKQGTVSEALLDSFNLPFYNPNASEMKEVISANKLLRIERMEEIYHSHPTKLRSPEFSKYRSQILRAALEGIFSEHFGSQHVDEIFERCSEKLQELSRMPHFQDFPESNLFLLVKKVNC